MATSDRVAALSEQLIQVHRDLRERLVWLRSTLADGTALADGQGRMTLDSAIPDDLLSHCLGFCAAIHAHHTGEDERLLPRLLAAAPSWPR